MTEMLLFDYRDLVEINYSTPFIVDLDPVTSTQKTIVIAVLLTVSVSSVFVNTLNLFRNRTTTCITNSLSFSDLLTTLFISVFEVGTFLNDGGWIYGRRSCACIAFFQTTCVFTGACFVGYIAVIRYKTLLKNQPAQQQTGLTLSNTTSANIAIWLFCAVFSSPMLSFYTLTEGFFHGKDWKITSVDFCLVKPNVNDKIVTGYYAVVLMVLFVPLAFTTIFIYTTIAHFLWIRRPVGNPQSRMWINQRKLKKSVVGKLISLMVVFILCKSPIYIYVCVEQFVKVDNSPESRVIKAILVILLLTNGLANPFFNAQFNQWLYKICVKFLTTCRMVTSSGEKTNRSDKNKSRDVNNVQSTKKTSLTLTRY